VFARHIEVDLKPNKYREFKSLFDREILSILKRQPGFMGTIEMVHETRGDHAMTITLWESKADAENYHKREFPQIIEIVRPLLVGMPTVEYYNVHFTNMKLEHTVAA
jgi:heme-degrading monooxygenase HmoA